MEDTKKGNKYMMHRLQNPFRGSGQLLLSSSNLDLSQLNKPKTRPHLPQNTPNLQNFGFDDKASNNRVAIQPSNQPISPNSQIPVAKPGVQNFAPGSSHSRSFSQSSFFVDDSLPPLNPSIYQNSTSQPSGSENVESSNGGLMESHTGNVNSMLPPTPYGMGNSFHITEVGEFHRRYYSEVPFEFDSIMESPSPTIDALPTLDPFFYQNSTSPLPNGGENVNSLNGGLVESYDGNVNSMLPPTTFGMGNSFHTTEVGEFHKRSSSVVPFGFGSIRQSPPPMNSHKRELSSKEMEELVDDLVSTYMNLDSIDAINSCGTNEKIGNEGFDDMGNRASGSKTNNGCDNSYNEAEGIVNEKPMVACSGESKRSAASKAATTTRHYRSVSVDSFMGKTRSGDESSNLPPSSSTNKIVNDYKYVFGNGDFTIIEMNKIMANPKLAKVALTDPKRAKRYVLNCPMLLKFKLITEYL